MIDIPDAPESLWYNGFPQVAHIGSDEAYVISGNTATDPGTYTATIRLKDKDNYLWKDGTSEDVKYTYYVYSVSFSEESTPTLNNSFSANSELYTPVKDGFNFVGWYDNPNFVGETVTAENDAGETVKATSIEIKPCDEVSATVTNEYTYKNNPADISVYKTWDDENDRDGIRPDSIWVALCELNENTGETEITETYEEITTPVEGAENTFVASFVYDSNKKPSFKEIGYTIDGVNFWLDGMMPDDYEENDQNVQTDETSEVGTFCGC